MREALQQSATNASRWYNRNVKIKVFSEGDKVRVFYPRRYKRRSPKWQSFFKTEGVIIKKLNDVTYIVRSSSWREPKVVYVDKLKLL